MINKLLSVSSSFIGKRGKVFTLCFITLFILSESYGQQPSRSIVSDSEKDLIPEGIAFDSRSGKIYVSSISKQTIIIIDSNGKHHNFIQPGQDNFLEGLGMKVDSKRNWLWALSNKAEGKKHTSQVHAFDLSSGKMQQYYFLTDTLPRLFNDLVIVTDGKIYFTDTYGSSVYQIDPVLKTMELIIKDPKIKYPNGIISGNNQQLYIATYGNGLMRFDLSTKEIFPLTGFKDSTLAFGFDGLGFWNNTLIGVYNSGEKRSTNAVVQYLLDKNGHRIIREKVLDKGHPLFHEPTTIAISKNKMYLLANSHLSIYNANKQSTKGVEDQLTPVTILQYQLKDRIQ